MIGKYEATIYEEGNGYTGAISLGFLPDGRRNRAKRKGRTKDIVKAKLKKLADELEAGVTSAESYTVTDAVRDWLDKGLKDRDPDTVTTNRILAEKHIIPNIGKAKLTKLRADDVDEWLDGLTDKLSTRTLLGVHSILKRSIRQAQARDKVIRNVAELVTTPKGKVGRPSKSLTLEQAKAVLKAAESSELHAYIVLSLMTGVRTEEARALRWMHVLAWDAKAKEWRPVAEAGFNRKRFAIYVWRSVRKHGDTKTRKSRRTLEIPKGVADALKVQHTRQAKWKLKAGEDWQDDNLVFCTRSGRPLDAGNVRRAFRAVTRRADIGEDWVPRELRHSFVSIMSDSGVPIETIADLVGHAGTSVTEKVYRHQLKPVITQGAQTMHGIFGDAPEKKARRSQRRRPASVTSA
ncbi:site-specific integrase [Actinomadura harenae]|uniref:Site-specific integrase n=2 Tax=Actinomadura harenae TaxID=2483351 RepID=A0A3M2M389_9ACTN|nr:site-specific integrase [Actinomadura harenae]